MRLISMLFFSTTLLGSATFAQEFALGDLRVTHPYARATAPGQPAAAVYLTIDNRGKQGDRLKSVEANVATSSEIHTMSMAGNVMKMREVGSIALAPMSSVKMAPGGGYHIMLIGLQKPLVAGEKFPLKLVFEKAGAIATSVSIEAIDARH
jgi:copper(I)-binding protein